MREGTHTGQSRISAISRNCTYLKEMGVLLGYYLKAAGLQKSALLARSTQTMLFHTRHKAVCVSIRCMGSLVPISNIHERALYMCIRSSKAVCCAHTWPYFECSMPFKWHMKRANSSVGLGWNLHELSKFS